MQISESDVKGQLTELVAVDRRRMPLSGVR